MNQPPLHDPLEYNDPADRPYGPGNPDYEHDERVQEEIEEDEETPE